MKILDPALAEKLEGTEYAQALLVTLDLPDANLSYTTWSEKLADEGVVYEPRGMKVSSIGYSSTNIVDSLSIDIDDVDRAIFGILGDLDAGRFPVKIKFAIINDIGSGAFSGILSSIVIFSGNINQWQYDPGKFRIKVSSIFEQWGRITTSKFSGSCRWNVFKGKECTYDGVSLTCDRTYTQCLAYGNQINFGGFRWLPSIVNKRITLE